MILNFPLINDFKTMNHRLFEHHRSAMCLTTNLVPRCLPPKASAKQHKKRRERFPLSLSLMVSRNSITMVCLAANIFFGLTMTRVVRKNYFFSSVCDRWRRHRLSVNCLQNFSRLRIFHTKWGARRPMTSRARKNRTCEKIISAEARWRRSRSATSPVIQPEYRTIIFC